MTEERFTTEEMISLARKGIQRVDEQGVRGATLVTTEEIIAMALVLALCGALPPVGLPALQMVAVNIDEAALRPPTNIETPRNEGELK